MHAHRGRPNLLLGAVGSPLLLPEWPIPRCRDDRFDLLHHVGSLPAPEALLARSTCNATHHGERARGDACQWWPKKSPFRRTSDLSADFASDLRFQTQLFGPRTEVQRIRRPALQSSKARLRVTAPQGFHVLRRDSSDFVGCIAGRRRPRT